MAPESLVGEEISHYRILERLDEGGMGVVYHATDVWLGRDVAIKVLPVETEQNSEALERFLREARAAAALNHPNICTIHEFGEEAGRRFLVMELLRGQTLKEKIAGGALEPLDIIVIGLQMADALAAAHRRGIVHRDIKPTNIFLTASGTAKLMSTTSALKPLRIGKTMSFLSLRSTSRQDFPAVQPARRRSKNENMARAP